ncbi:MAG: hypothetical protein L6R42_005547 [Xanthoria sp. 1 TBL-2021]|nr:MAG: hypothetical protein L6R42_005547 [Xanthoria sp. 1 TBL-2021]
MKRRDEGGVDRIIDEETEREFSRMGDIMGPLGKGRCGLGDIYIVHQISRNKNESLSPTYPTKKQKAKSTPGTLTGTQNMQPYCHFDVSLFLVLLNLIFPSSALPSPNPSPLYSTHIQAPSTLSPRDWRDPAYRNLFNRVVVLGGGWALYYNTLDVMRPNVPTGAESLLQFYDLILASLDAEWEPRQQVYASTPGGISLAVYSAETLITKEWLRPFINALVCVLPLFGGWAGR